ncbi:hemolysin III family protein [Tepidibacillus sp. HK-1]|uniref:PAQR family membrane homeostasis protein TrhA n=1 Tax=Tepidibacillus sp. HK-1 TaxID=1883407 RepID=UPI00085796C5|nr:hemolysin III family protein [Tepidibacillus sp. HK-1]GBF12349.1 hemolysin-III related [Tepidibacillus sp. HK-1]
MKNILKMKEPVNTWTHFVSFIAAIVGLVFLVILSRDNLSKLVIMTIYGISVILLYGASSLYHWIKTTPKKELVLKKLDHVAIYILIAGSYTPVFYFGLEGIWKWAMLISVWVLAIIGIILKIWFIHLPRYVSTAFYVSLGWIALVPLFQLIGQLPTGAMVLMFVGGVAYTIGAIIYATKWLDFFPNRFGFHEIFHIFVVIGSVVHFFMMLFYIIPL